MSLLQIIVLALIQGITEFLPISSSAHLILPSALLGWPDQGLAFDVAVHVGTLGAVLIYFRNDVRNLVVAWCKSTFAKQHSDDSRIAWLIVLATIPTGIAGLLFNDFVEEHLRSLLVIAMTTIVFGLLLGAADKFSARNLRMEKLNWRHALLIGIAQAIALIPGTSRSGITLTMALALGYERVSAARFSFLLSIPIIVLSGAYKAVELLQLNSVPWGDIMLAAIIAGITAYICIHAFLAWINRIGMMPFVWYRLLLGLFLIGFAWMGMA
ncbi:MAG: undecaprenyl-diphosphate phosphatase [Porticoccaceae bacterium]